MAVNPLRLNRSTGFYLRSLRLREIEREIIEERKDAGKSRGSLKAYEQVQQIRKLPPVVFKNAG